MKGYRQDQVSRDLGCGDAKGPQDGERIEWNSKSSLLGEKIKEMCRNDALNHSMVPAGAMSTSSLAGAPSPPREKFSRPVVCGGLNTFAPHFYSRKT
mmetsp:Transcript_5042/g.12175  ORF Transcript_5042/g.12175 Transcript_5042/m.12175 type:complete len:97 (-) Transcript_5042:243-533(-)